jgi:hypothetical protein
MRLYQYAFHQISVSITVYEKKFWSNGLLKVEEVFNPNLFTVECNFINMFFIRFVFLSKKIFNWVILIIISKIFDLVVLMIISKIFDLVVLIRYKTIRFLSKKIFNWVILIIISKIFDLVRSYDHIKDIWLGHSH